MIFITIINFAEKIILNKPKITARKRSILHSMQYIIVQYIIKEILLFFTTEGAYKGLTGNMLLLQESNNSRECHKRTNRKGWGPPPHMSVWILSKANPPIPTPPF